MSALALAQLDPSALARLGVLQGTEAILPPRAVLRLGWPDLERALPDRGLPRGVVELAALPHVASSRSASRGCPDSMRGGTTTVAIAAARAVHAADAASWCAWITPASTGGDAPVPSLHAPALAQAGVDLDRLLVVRPSPQALARTAVKAASSGAFALLVIDLPHRYDLSGGRPSRMKSAASLAARGGRPALGGAVTDEALVVRKLALAAEESGTTSLLLTSALSPRSAPWPVTMRVEVERRPDALSVRVTKDRRGPGSSQHVVRLAEPSLAFAPAHGRGAVA